MLPPNNEEKNLYLDWQRNKLYSFGTLSLISLVIGMALFLRAHEMFLLFLPVMGLTAIYLAVSYLIVWTSSPFSKALHEFSKQAAGSTRKPVDILYPTCGEPLVTIVDALVTIRLAADAWHPDSTVWVLDDSGRVEVAAIADQLQMNYRSRPNKGEGKKAGNLLSVWPELTHEFFCIFDADFRPSIEFFPELMPHFSTKKVAIVQSPQFFRVEGNWISKGAAQVQELFYRIIQVARDHWGASICVGTNAIYRREAFPNGTYQIPYSEDVHTGWDAKARGYWIQYVPLNLAVGECPTKVKNFFVQQYRWAMGSLSLAGNVEFWRSPIGVMKKLCYSCGFGYYISTGLSVIVAFLPSLFVLVYRPDMFKYWNYFFVLPSLLFSTIGMAYWSKAKFGVYSLVVKRISSGAHFSALVDRMTGKMIPWQPTGGAVSSSWKFYAWLGFQWFWPCLMTGVLLTVGLATVPMVHLIPTVLTAGLELYLAGCVLALYAKHG